ncbi:hypothetical protein C0Q44_23075 [Paenibacillus sp. PCH8]|uniref:helix-turn-helix domain-containing protein n=1 Tax=Paenibacillus sp. PCH8 TaxID=2066524 RepID=UPI000CF91F9D|nr:helix-turn-helix domain-containing protein [Paenibacillus sp. PCH8]PQP81290.1 hypothetical protein C0Q44_23075 [Paenibacillus sp. PCH8]
MHSMKDSIPNDPIKVQFLHVKDEPFRWVNSIEVVIVLEGSIQVSIADEQRILGSGAIEIFNINQVHRLWQTHENNVILQLNMDAEFAEDHVPELPKVWYVHEFNAGSYLGSERTKEIIKTICTSISPMIYKSEVPWKTYKETVKRLLELLLENFDFRRKYQGNPTKLQRIEKIYDYLFHNRGYINKVSLHDISKNTEEYLNLDYLSSQFKLLIGDTFQNLLHYLRIEHAIKQLLTTDLSLVDISMESGFSAPRFFYQQFNKMFPEGPKEFRKQHKKKQEVIEHSRITLDPTTIIQRHRELFGNYEVIEVEHNRWIRFDLFRTENSKSASMYMMDIPKLLQDNSREYLEMILQVNNVDPSNVFGFGDTSDLLYRDIEVLTWIMDRLRENNVFPVFIIDTSSGAIPERMTSLQRLFKHYAYVNGEEYLKGWKIEFQ